MNAQQQEEIKKKIHIHLSEPRSGQKDKPEGQTRWSVSAKSQAFQWSVGSKESKPSRILCPDS